MISAIVFCIVCYCAFKDEPWFQEDMVPWLEENMEEVYEILKEIFGV